MWQFLIKWRESNDEYTNMVVRGPLKTDKPILRYHVTVNPQNQTMFKSSDAEKLSHHEDAMQLALSTASEVHRAKQLLKSSNPKESI
jgi:hypothetical protein